MKIAFVVPRFFPYRGGQENYVLKLSQQLHRYGHDVFVLTSNAFDLESFWIPGFRTLPAGLEYLEGIEIRRFPISYRKWIRRSGRLLAYVGNWRWKARYSAPGFCVKGLPSALRQLRPNVVHISPLPYTRLMYEGLREGLRCGARVIATPCVHFGEDNSSEVARYYTQDFQIRLLNECQAVLTMTDMERSRLAELGIDRHKLRTTAHGIDMHEVTGGNEECFRRRWNVTGPVVLQLGTKTEDKGTIAVVEAMKSLWAQGTEAWLVLAGASTSGFDDYLRIQQNLPRLLNLGPVDEAEKRDLLAAMDILVHPSRVESLGIVYLEAWANAKPVIAADTAASRAVVTRGHDGLLVPFGDSGAIAGAIRQLLEDPDQRQRLGDAGREKVLAKYSWEAVLPEILQVFSGQQLDSGLHHGPIEEPWGVETRDR
jgi:glycosyltransferase involved in cell wall biosynthesis